jgi:hypothetical protein
VDGLLFGVFGEVENVSNAANEFIPESRKRQRDTSTNGID